MQKKTLLASLVVATLTTHAVAAQSLLETYEQAVANDPSLAIARLQSESAQQDVTSGFANVLPSVSASVNYGVGTESFQAPTDEESLAFDFDRQRLSASLQVQQNIFVLAAFTAYDAVKVNASLKEMEAAQAEQDLLVTVAEKYINALKAKEALDVLNAQLEAVDRQYEQTQQRYDVGLVTITDVLDAEATLDQTRVSLIRAESQYDIALQDLYTLTGSVPDGVMSISENVPVDAPAESGQQKWVDFAVSNHPEVLMAQKGLEVGELTLKAERERLLPSVGGQFSLDYSDVFGSDPVGNDNEQNWSASVGISIGMDLYSGGANQARIAKQGITNNITEQNIEMLKRNIAVQVANLYRTVRADAENVDAQIQALESRESALQATTVGYDVGTRNIVEVLNAQLAVFSAQNALNNARYDYLLNLLRLKQAAGQLSIADLDSIEQYLVN
ncbi:TolC family outer membrane protein [Reinekea blandensis]|uniref:Outer membrane protein n=1 Tax=Reinekea blandensis MED297 TaxID=314283 RepID=A4B8Y6_9GAMM|nr:TolC family outer membrane protein [Reinekea blandensis]EAR11087.1 Outer membrane protein [Reinekea sp. MED297] [Reinekea blandensis MED297]